MMKIVSAELIKIRMPLVVPYVGAGGSRSSVDRTLVRLRTEDGLQGLGETVGSASTFGFLTAICQALLGEDGLDRTALRVRIAPPTLRDSEGRDGWMAVAGIEMALWDLAGKRYAAPVWELLGGAVRRRVPVALCFGAASLPLGATREEAVAFIADDQNVARLVDHVARFARQDGCGTVKMKSLGVRRDWDVAVMAGLREALGPAVELRLDPNAAMSLPEALALCTALEPLRLEYYEDPTWGLEGMASLRRRLRTPLAGNMCVVEFNDLSSAVRLGALDVVLGDVFCWGGLSALGELAAICRTFGLDLVIHSWFELGVATAANLHLAAAIPHIKRAMDCTLPLHAGDIVTGGKPQIREGMLSVPDAPGLGVSLDDGAVNRYAIERWEAML
ncbi:MAG TPA: enolase C-terminal domain-like protein [bacterium]|nr:enolase C-terminal domain-like protein [bacterium]